MDIIIIWVVQSFWRGPRKLLSVKHVYSLPAYLHGIRADRHQVYLDPLELLKYAYTDIHFNPSGLIPQSAPSPSYFLLPCYSNPLANGTPFCFSFKLTLFEYRREVQKSKYFGIWQLAGHLKCRP